MVPKRSTETDSPGGTAAATHYVLGGQHLGAAVARRLQAEGHHVRLVEAPDDIPGARETPDDLSGIDVVRGDPTEVEVLAAAGMSETSTVVVATGSDRRNLLIAQLVATRFDPYRVLVLANAPPRIELFAEAGHEPICVTSALSEALVENV
jgi:trk system potassium uptake protein TrkA